MRKGVSLKTDRFKYHQKRNVKLLRKHSTPEEEILWENIRNKKLKGLKFRRQHAIGRFIVDFYCHRLKLIIEIDGGIHKQNISHDQYRERILRDMGYHMIRFRNDDVVNSLDRVLQKIVNLAKKIMISS